jgi:hypothetical protein
LFSTGACRNFGTILEKKVSLAAPQNLEPNMNARKEIRDHLIAARMKRWLDIARCPIMNTRVPTWKAGKNFWSLCRKHPEIATRLGYSEALIIPSPLRDLKPTPESPAQQPALHALQSISLRMVALEDEIL